MLADDNFATITHAVEEGRTIYDNLKKSILFLLPTNGGESLIVIAAILFDLTLPLSSVQILWINMATSVTLGIALAFEKTEGDIMERPPRSPDEPLLTGFFIWRIIYVSTLMMLGAMALFMWELQRGNSIETARTIAVSVVVATEIFYLFNCRHLHQSSLSLEGLFSNHFAWAATGALIVMQLAFTYTPFMQHLFGSAPLDLGEWFRVFAISAFIFFVIEAEKTFHRTRMKKSSH